MDQTIVYVAPAETVVGAKMICVAPGTVQALRVVKLETAVLEPFGKQTPLPTTRQKYVVAVSSEGTETERASRGRSPRRSGGVDEAPKYTSNASGISVPETVQVRSGLVETPEAPLAGALSVIVPAAPHERDTLEKEWIGVVAVFVLSQAA